jgi:multimeric flavodoxin WrbA
MDPVLRHEITSRGISYTLTLSKQDLSSIYPGLIRYEVLVNSGGQVLARSCTNSYEYSPTMPLTAEQVARDLTEDWSRELEEDPEKFLTAHKIPKGKAPAGVTTDVVVIQGSPRADGNCSILAEWAVEAVNETGRTIQVIYPHDLDIHACIGCYQCYNTGTCTFEDDMNDIIGAIRHASMLIVCSPVYTNSVPGDLKLLIDRCQAYHAQRTVTGQTVNGKQGLILSVAGRKGRDHFSCITSLITAFMRNIGISSAGKLLIDGVDEARDIRNMKNLKDDVRALIGKTFERKN